MLDAEPPFDSIDLALVSHEHRDHFQADTAREFLRRHPGCRLASSPNVVSQLADDEEVEDQLQEVLPKPGEIETIEYHGIRVDVLRIQHGGERWAKLHNLGHIIHLGGRLSLHLGDAGMDQALFEPYDLPQRELDVAIVPYWYLQYSDGRQVFEGHLRARHVIATHVPPTEVEAVTRELGELYPTVEVLAKPLDSRRY